MDQRSMLRIVFWMVFGCLVILSISPNPVIDTSRPGYFIDNKDNLSMLLIGIVGLAVLVWLGLRI